jgi:hypothetical protein
MNHVNVKKAKIKNLIGIIDNPCIEDLLFEIAYFLHNEKRYDGIFSTREVSLKTRVRVSEDLSNDLDKLEELGYIKKLKYTQFELLKHLWE